MKRLIFIMVLCLSSSVQADILFQDPTGKAFGAAIDKLSEEELKDLSTSDANRKKLFLGIFYIKGAPGFHVEKDCEKAVDFLQDAWESDITDAGYSLATMYYNGVCTDKDIDKARELATQAAQEGYILAQRMLGLAYVGEKWEELYPYDVEKGIYWLSKAGNAGDGRSSGQMAYMYRKGEGVSRDDKKSFLWLKKSVFNKYEKGINIGFHILAERYEKGMGTEKDLVKAYKYYDLSGTAGAEGKQRVAKKMTQEQIDEAIRQSRTWQEEHNTYVPSYHGLERQADGAYR
ncbi:tetratricopeptide repeat protein [Chromohalobacter nigrandesensis]|uniref:tetratricopeptide repeat protein n=1 Tax=Chromohalobacter nigrandesensis TaxID=119863 RepID=UPI001FF65640|nr:tetratricopeptide repeat protein [Chromohalobacter nigrandesensis]MCK0746827.1 sel1 repeat family protein [Chromohalobacter nigrandesensis]